MEPDLLAFASELGIDPDDELLPEAMRVPLSGVDAASMCCAVAPELDARAVCLLTSRGAQMRGESAGTSMGRSSTTRRRLAAPRGRTHGVTRSCSVMSR